MRLTERQKHILELLSEGLSNRQISRLLGISEPAVHGRLNTIYQKLGVENRIQAVMEWKGRRRLLTVNEVAEMLRVHPNTVREWERGGRLRSYRLGGRRDRRFDPEEIEEFLRRG